MYYNNSAAKLPKCRYNKSRIKTGSLCDKRGTYYFLSIKGNAWISLVILSLNPSPATL